MELGSTLHIGVRDQQHQPTRNSGLNLAIMPWDQQVLLEPLVLQVQPLRLQDQQVHKVPLVPLVQLEQQELKAQQVQLEQLELILL
jgi:hypothetical protein